jgi:D-glycero-D-manno-heptose 1,7-bisphosphate phosphatase
MKKNYICVVDLRFVEKQFSYLDYGKSSINPTKKLIYEICSYNFSKVYLVINHKKKDLIKNFKNKKILGIKIDLIVRENDKDDLNFFKNLNKKIKNGFLLVNVKNYKSIDLDNFYKLLSNQMKKIQVPFISKKKNIYKGCGLFFFRKNQKILEISNIYNKKYYSNNFNKYNFIKVIEKRKFQFNAVFLDRDGVINKDKGWIHKIKDFDILDGVVEGIKLINNKKFLVIIITNQSGIGRGLYSIKQFFKLQNYFLKILYLKNSVYDDLFFCPHHPKHAIGVLKRKCECRKPGSKMLEDAIKKWSINKKNSFMIGDKDTDRKAAKKAKIDFFYKKNINFEKQIKQILN